MGGYSDTSSRYVVAPVPGTAADGIDMRRMGRVQELNVSSLTEVLR